MKLCRKCGADSESKNCCENGALVKGKAEQTELLGVANKTPRKTAKQRREEKARAEASAE